MTQIIELCSYKIKKQEDEMLFIKKFNAANLVLLPSIPGLVSRKIFKNDEEDVYMEVTTWENNDLRKNGEPLVVATEEFKVFSEFTDMSTFEFKYVTPVKNE